MKALINRLRSLLPGHGWTHGKVVCHNCKHMHHSVHHTAALWLECPRCGGMHRYGVYGRNSAEEWEQSA